jgi:hypothetical protein
VIFAEALGILMRTNVEIKGVQLPNEEFILSCRFADDTAVVCIPASIGPAMDMVEIFSARPEYGTPSVRPWNAQLQARYRL